MVRTRMWVPRRLPIRRRRLLVRVRVRSRRLRRGLRNCGRGDRRTRMRAFRGGGGYICNGRHVNRER